MRKLNKSRRVVKSTGNVSLLRPLGLVNTINLTNSALSQLSTTHLASLKSMANITLEPLKSSRSYSLEITIFSNYGVVNKITLEDINVFNPNHQILPISRVIFNADFNYTTPAVLPDGRWNSDANSFHFSGHWNGKPFTITFIIETDDQIGYIRLWNSTVDILANAKDILLKLGSELEIKQTIPPDMGCLVNVLKYSAQLKADINEIKTKHHQTLVTDQYGDLPIFQKTKNIAIELIVLHNSPEYVGLNQIEIYDCSGSKVLFSNIKEVKIGGGVPLNGTNCLFNGDVKTSAAGVDNFRVKRFSDIIKISIDFHSAVVLGHITIYNHCCNFRDSCFPARWGKIYVNDNVVWRGKLVQPNFSSLTHENLPTNIWLSDIPNKSWKYNV